MNTLQELQNLAFYILIFSLQVCTPVILGTLAAMSTPKLNWSKEEIDYLLLEHRTDICEGRSDYERVAAALTKKDPSRPRTHNAVTSKLGKARTFHDLNDQVT